MKNPMSAADIAFVLERLGFKVAGVADGDDISDAMVELSATVHVQVPQHDLPGVVKENADGTFSFLPPRDTVLDLAADLASCGVRC